MLGDSSTCFVFTVQLLMSTYFRSFAFVFQSAAYIWSNPCNQKYISQKLWMVFQQFLRKFDEKWIITYWSLFSVVVLLINLVLLINNWVRWLLLPLQWDRRVLPRNWEWFDRQAKWNHSHLRNKIRKWIIINYWLLIPWTTFWKLPLSRISQV